MATAEEAKTVTGTEAEPTKEARKPSISKEDADVPKGFDTRVGREKGDGWLVKSAGQVIQGRLLGRYSLRGQENDDGTLRMFYQIRLAGGHEVKAQYTNPDNKEEKIDVTLGDGDILNVDEHKALEELATYAQDGGVYNVWFKYMSEDAVRNSGKKKRTFWRINGPRLQIIKPPVIRQATPADNTGIRRGEDEQDIPF